jgi:uncharacterized protein (TIGR03437 family)
MVTLDHGIATDAVGQTYFASSSLNAVFKLDTAGMVTRVAGTGLAGFSGDGEPATSAQLNFPLGVAVDASGNLYIADTSNRRIRKVASNGTITTVAGNGRIGYSGDGGPATSAQVNWPMGVAVDASGNLYIADSVDCRIRRVSQNGTITTVAGNGTAGYRGDRGPAVSAQLDSPNGVAVGASGDLYIADTDNHRIRKVAPDGTMSTVAGNGTAGYGGDGGPATSAALSSPRRVAMDTSGNLYITDFGNNRIRRVDPNGIIWTVAGNGTSGFGGDGGLATDATVSNATDVSMDTSGNLYILDTSNERIRKVSPAGTIATVVGGPVGDGGPGVFVGLHELDGLAYDSGGNLYLADATAQRVRRIAPTGVITTVAGNGSQGYSGDGGPAVNAQLSLPRGVATDAGGNLYIAEAGNSRIRKVASNGTISTVAGTGGVGFGGDGGQALNAWLNHPWGVAVDASGNLYIADTTNHRIRKVIPDGNIATIAGTGTAGFGGDGGPATSAMLNAPVAVTLDTSGNLYIADRDNQRVRKLAPNGTISTVAGNGTNAYGGDSGPATSAQLYAPNGVVVDASGNLYITDTQNHRVRQVAPGGTITTVAGSGAPGLSGDGGPATSARFNHPRGVAVDRVGNVCVGDEWNNAVRLLTPAGTKAVLTVRSTHTANFVFGQSGTYTLSVTNAISAGATSGAVTVTNLLPAGLTVRSISGSGWTCSGSSCTRSDALSGGASYPPITVTVNVSATALAQVTNQVSVSGGGAATTGSADLTLIVARQITGVVNGASFAGAPSPGSVATIFGGGLASASESAATVPLPVSVAGSGVTINGTAAPLWYVSPQQINFQLPADVTPGPATAVVTSGGAPTAPFSFTVPRVAPGVIVYGNNRAVAVNPDYSLNDADHPAAPDSVITVYLTGIGPLDNPVATNTQTPSQPLSRPTLAAAVTIGGQNAPIVFLGLTPGGIALAQANVTVPSLAAGDYPVVVTIGGVSSNGPLITVGGG